MLTRITRYTLLVLCLLLAGVWGWSSKRLFEVHHSDVSNRSGRTWVILVFAGRVVIVDTEYLDTKPFGFSTESAGVHHRGGLLGLCLPYKRFTAYMGYGATDYSIPFWTFFVPLLIMTAAMWHRPIRNRLRGKRDVGFAVEPKQPEPVKD